MPTPDEYLAVISRIVGFDVADPAAKTSLSWNNPEEARGHRRLLRQQQKELKFLKREINSMISVVESEFPAARTTVGRGFGAGLAAGFFGRRMAGRVNAARRDALRRERQQQAVAPYNGLKLLIDRLIVSLNSTRAQLESSFPHQTRAGDGERCARPRETAASARAAGGTAGTLAFQHR